MLPFSVSDTALSVTRDGFARLPAAATEAVLGGDRAAWDAFAASWDDLRTDTYMADGGRYRLRRHAIFAAIPGDPVVRRQANGPHWQSRTHNALNGGVARWFAPVADVVADGAVLPALLRLGRLVFDRVWPLTAWHVEAHQFRIMAETGLAGQPTPEGVHQDGVDGVLILLVGRDNIRGGETMVQDAAGAELARFTLGAPGEAMVLDDARLRHGVTPLLPADPARPGYRDVLVLTYRRAGGAGADARD